MSIHVVWRGYLRWHKNLPGPRILLQIGGSAPSRTRELINADYRRTGDEESFKVRMDTLEQWANMYTDCAPLVVPTPATEWKTLADGGHQRRTHIGNTN